MPRTIESAGTGGAHGDPLQDVSGWREVLRDGTRVWVRAIRPQDAALELEFLKHLAPERRGARFLGLVRAPDPEAARELTDLDPAVAEGFLALVPHGDGHQEVGAAHFHINRAGDACDCALAVSQDWQNRGIGMLLMRRLIDAARERGVRHMRASASLRFDSNHGHLATRLGFRSRPDDRDPTSVVYELTL